MSGLVSARDAFICAIIPGSDSWNLRIVIACPEKTACHLFAQLSLFADVSEGSLTPRWNHALQY